MRTIRTMRELKLLRQSLNYKSRHLEASLKGRSDQVMISVAGRLKEIAFETGLKIILNLFFRKNKKQRAKTKEESKNEES